MNRGLCILVLFLPAITFGALPVGKWADSMFHHLIADRKASLTEKSKTCNKLLAIYKKEKNTCKWIEVALLKSGYLLSSGRSVASLALLNTCDSLLTRHQCRNPESLLQMYLAYSRVHYLQGENSKAKGYAQRGIDYFTSHSQDKTLLAQLYISKGNTYTEPDSQIYYYQKAYRISLEKNDLETQGTSLNEMGCVYASINNREKAIYYFRNALRIALKRNASQMVSALYNNLAGLTDNDALVVKYLDSAKYYAKLRGDLEDLQTAFQNASSFYYDKGEYKQACDNLIESNAIKDSLFNRDKINAFADMEQKYQAALLEEQIKLLNEQNTNKSRQRNGLVLGSILLLAISIAVVRQRNNANREKKRSDTLLLNILPEEVAEELKSKGSAEAKHFDEVTVLFTDFKDFTMISEQMTPKELVEEIHTCFKAFDTIVEKYNIEKIKTIGDSYMCAGGLPVVNKTHALDVVNAGLDIQYFIDERSRMRVAQGKTPFQIRIGIHTGPVVAGIVGIKKFAYDIWGDTVNTASRMESSGEVGKVNISETTYELVKDKFTCTYRGKIQAKNKGELDMYYVEGKS